MTAEHGAVFGLPRFILRYSYIGEKIKKYFLKKIGVTGVTGVTFFCNRWHTIDTEHLKGNTSGNTSKLMVLPFTRKNQNRP